MDLSCLGITDELEYIVDGVQQESYRTGNVPAAHTSIHMIARYKLQSSQSNQLIVPPVKLSTYGPRSFAAAGPTTWNNLPEYLHDPELSTDNFRRQLKTFLFAQYSRRHPSTLETFVPVRSIYLLFTLHYITAH